MKIGILTFHRVYNYGAVLQAYSTQKILEGLNIENELIDFSIPRQKDFTSLYSTKNGFKRFVKTMLLLPLHSKRAARVKKFDDYISRLNLSAKTYYREEELFETNNLYDGFMVGSDQVWNVRKKAESSDAYFLNFASDDKLKFSYATSIGTSDINDLSQKKPYIDKFAALSCREIGGTKILQKLTNKDVKNVLDPTLLVEKKCLQSIAKENNMKPYLFYYSLDGYDKKDKHKEILLELCKKFDLELKLLTPEWPYHNYGEDIVDAGPEDFLGLISNASLVCTNSFHGTALSIKLNTPFFVLESRQSNDERKRSILEQLNLKNRIISDVGDIENFDGLEIDYEVVNKKLSDLQEYSMQYLKGVLLERNF